SEPVDGGNDVPTTKTGAGLRCEAACAVARRAGTDVATPRDASGSCLSEVGGSAANGTTDHATNNITVVATATASLLFIIVPIPPQIMAVDMAVLVAATTARDGVVNGNNSITQPDRSPPCSASNTARN